MLTILASIAVVLLIIFVVILKMLLRKYYKVSGKAAKGAYEGFLPYPIVGVEGNTESEKAASGYNSMAKVSIMVIIFCCVVIVVFSMVDYFKK